MTFGKTLAYTVTALVLYFYGAFAGAWQVPVLDAFPTAERLGAIHQNATYQGVLGADRGVAAGRRVLLAQVD